jgi:DNA-binding HxlR family transcriptional regulator
VTSYGQFCPVSKAAEVVCQRWTPLILRELLVGSSRFNDIRRGVPTCSPALLSKRLKQLETAGVIDRTVTEAGPVYSVTEAGWELFPVIQGLGVWGQRWARSDYGPDDLDPGLLLWDVRRFLAPGAFGKRRVVIHLKFPSLPAKRRYYWVVVDATEVDLCLTDPGFDVDVDLAADLRTLTEVWMGDVRFADALADGQITLTGPRVLTQRIPDWFGQHPILAGVDRGWHSDVRSAESIPIEQGIIAD